jgi:hypothetical protein
MSKRMRLVAPLLAFVAIVTYSAPKVFDGSRSTPLRVIHGALVVVSVWSTVVMVRRFKQR